MKANALTASTGRAPSTEPTAHFSSKYVLNQRIDVPTAASDSTTTPTLQIMVESYYGTSRLPNCRNQP